MAVARLTRRLTPSIALLAGLGVVTAVAVAWSASLLDGRATERTDSHHRCGQLMIGGWVMNVRVAASPFSESYIIYPAVLMDPLRYTSDGRPILVGEAHLPRCLIPRPRSTDPVDMRDDEYLRVVYGWPLHCLWRGEDDRYSLPKASRFKRICSIPIGILHRSDGAPRQIPLGVMGAALGMNTAVFACAWGLPWAAFLWLRGSRRSRRGLCPRCAYPLLQNPGAAKGCPECGFVKASSTPSA